MSQFILSAFGDEINEDLSMQMDTLAEHGIKHIEIRGVYGRNIASYTPAEAKAIKKQLDDRGFKVSAVGSPIGKIKITDDMAPEMEKFKRILEIAHILETAYIRVFSFFIPPGEDAGNYRDEVLSRYAGYLDTAKGSGLTLLHENEKDIYGDIPERCLDLFKTLSSPYLFATFDPANFVQCGVEAFPYAFELLRPYIKYLHIKDAEAKSGRVVPAGTGDGGLKEIIGSLKSSGYTGFLTLEPHLADFKGFAELENGGSIQSDETDSVRAFSIAAAALKNLLPK